MTTTLETTAVHSPRAIVPHSGGPGAAFVRFLKRIPAWLTIAFLIIVTAYPLFWMFINSLKSNSDFLNNPSYAFPEVWQWSNYPLAWETGNLGDDDLQLDHRDDSVARTHRHPRNRRRASHSRSSSSRAVPRSCCCSSRAS